MSMVWRRLAAPAAAVLALGYLTVMVIQGALPHSKQLVEYEAHGVLDLAPETIDRVTLTAEGQTVVFVHGTEGWKREDNGEAIEGQLAESLVRAVKFMHTSNPVRELTPDDIADTPLTDYGIDDKSMSIALEKGGNVVLEAEFGNYNGDGLLQYMRTKGDNGVYMMSSFVGKEWSTVAKATLP